MFGFRIIRKLVSAALLLVIVLPLFAVGRTWYSGHNSTPIHSDVIVVLGAAQFDGRPSEVLTARLSEAKRLFIQGFAPKIITVGAGAPGDRTTEAAAGRKWLLDEGMKATAVIAIEKGRDTYVSTQSYIAEMKKLGANSVLIVTDPYHCLRATTMARDLGAKSSCSPVRTGPNSLAHFDLHYLLRETEAYLAYVTLGRRGIHVSDHLGQA
jgi:uncharacterized SAM-binding protein YcdF (DUF218 family)